MDRLHTLRAGFGSTASLVSLLVLLGGCDDQSATAEKPPARFEAVTAKAAVSEKQLAGFCDVRDVPGFKLPELDGGAVPPATANRWVNVWATWCQSCVEEMPMIESWRRKWGADVLFVSADEEADSLVDFQQRHPELPASRHMTDPEALRDWMKTLKLGSGSGLPLHIFVEPNGRVLCARAGAVNESHAPIVESLLK